jgi:hypothetical protein
MPTVYLSTSELATESQASGPSGSSLELSPFDIPRSATVELERARMLLRVRFTYSDQEPTTEKEFDGVTVRVGKHSGKVLALQTSCTQHDSGVSVGLRLANALRNEAAAAKRDNQRLHYGLLSQLFHHDSIQAALGKAFDPQP